jgi:hypothetical protein
MTEPRDLQPKIPEEQTPTELLDREPGRYVLVGTDGSTESWQIGLENVISEEGERTGDKQKNYTRIDDYFDDWENGCDGEFFRDCMDRSRHYNNATAIKVERTNLHVPKIPWDKTPIVNVSDVHVFLLGNQREIFHAKPGEYPVAFGKIVVAEVHNDFGIMREIKIIDSNGTEVTADRFQSWLKENNLEEKWQFTTKFA